MKRRRFLRNIGLGGSGVVMTEKLLAKKTGSSEYSYGRITSLDQAKTKEGLINIRLKFQSKIPKTNSSNKGKIVISNGKINRIKEYFFEESEDLLDGGDYDITVSNEKSDIIAIWIEDASPITKIQIKDKEGKAGFSLQELVTKHEISLPFRQAGMEMGSLQVTANFLLDKEIAEIEPEDFGAKDPGNDFKFVVMADPQGGDPEEEGNHPTRMKIHNAWVEESVKQTNLMKPAATLILGDIVDGQGQTRNFVQMAHYFSKLKSPILYAIGNHETRYK
ncbi:MAG: metallophosphoesterase, partial [Cyclobacteriaceae bacterium]|nr:metallophosphoesterase [Cyclobacteriaceae bacterium]